MARKIGKSFSVQPPDPGRYKGIPLRRFLEDIARWLRDFAMHSAEPGSKRDRFIAETAGTITANAGVDGPMGFGDVVYKQIQDDRTLDAPDDTEMIEVDNLIYTTIAAGELVIVERIEGKYVITAVVCP